MTIGEANGRRLNDSCLFAIGTGRSLSVAALNYPLDMVLLHCRHGKRNFKDGHSSPAEVDVSNFCTVVSVHSVCFCGLELSFFCAVSYCV